MSHDPSRRWPPSSSKAHTCECRGKSGYHNAEAQRYGTVAKRHDSPSNKHGRADNENPNENAEYYFHAVSVAASFMPIGVLPRNRNRRMFANSYIARDAEIVVPHLHRFRHCLQTQRGKNSGTMMPKNTTDISEPPSAKNKKMIRGCTGAS